MAVNHENAHRMITALSFTDEGRNIVKYLEDMRYYHRDGESFYLGDGARLIISRNENPDYYDDNKIIGVVYLPGIKNGRSGNENLFVNKACWPHDATEAALFWPFPKDMDEVWEVIKHRDDIKNASCIYSGAVVSKMMKTANPPVLIPLELAHWATELVIHRSDWAERPADESRPVWREVLVKNPGNGTMRTLIKAPSAEIGLSLTSLDDNGDVREIPVVSGDARDVFARKINQEKAVNKRSTCSVVEKPFADWEWELLKMEDDSIDARRYEVMVQDLASKYGTLAKFGRRLRMRDIRDAVRWLHEVAPEDLGSLQTVDIYDQRQKSAIRRVVAIYRDGDINNDIVEDDGSIENATPAFMHSFELFESMKKMLNMVTNYKHRDYFDSISPVQALVHLVNDNYEPHDIEF